MGLTSEAVLVNQRGDIAGEQLTRLDPRGGGQLVTHAAGPLVLSEAAPVSLLFFIFRGSHIVSSAQGKSDMTGWPPRSVGEVVWYTASLGIAYAALTQPPGRHSVRDPPPKQKR